MKYILVTGGVISGVGKGVIASSIGHLLQNNNINTTFIKIDPYLNIDAGNLTPYDHGEVFVLCDGHQVDLDLGNYERFLDICLTKEHSITTGKIYKEIIEREREGYYQGQTIQMVPHVTNLIISRIEKAANKHTIRGSNSSAPKQKPEICIIELGGTIGDIESYVFIEALRQLKLKNPKKFLIVSVEHIPIINNEYKTKTVQNSARIARTLGISPDVIIARAEAFKDRSFKDKISLFCEVKRKNIIAVKDLPSIYSVPNLLCKKKILNVLAKKFKFNLPNNITNAFSHLMTVPKTEIQIAIVGKYIENTDCYLSLKNAITFSGAHLNVKVNELWIDAEKIEKNDKETLEILKKVHGILIPGGFGLRGFEGKIKTATIARELNAPFLGICLGFQSAVISFCRNVLNMKNAISEEICIEVARTNEKERRRLEKKELVKEVTKTSIDKQEKSVCIKKKDCKKIPPATPSKLSLKAFIIEDDEIEDNKGHGVKFDAMKERRINAKQRSALKEIVEAPAKVIVQMEGKEMRVGEHKMTLKEGIVHNIYGSDTIYERHRHKYEVDSAIVENCERNGLFFTGTSAYGRNEIFEMKDKKFYVGTQFHPELQARPNRPHPIFTAFIKACMDNDK